MNQKLMIEEPYLSQLQAAFFRNDAAQLRLNDAANAAQKAEETLERVRAVVENKYQIKIGVTHGIDVETGEIKPHGSIQVLHPAPVPPAPEPGGEPGTPAPAVN